jgi:hypothetical protein
VNSVAGRGLLLQLFPRKGDFPVQRASDTLLRLLCCSEFLFYYRLEGSHMHGCLHKTIFFDTGDRGLEKVDGRLAILGAEGEHSEVMLHESPPFLHEHIRTEVFRVLMVCGC